MLRVRAVLCSVLLLSLSLAVPSSAHAGAEARTPEERSFGALWERVLAYIEEFLAAAPAPREPRATTAADDGEPPPPPNPTGRGGMDPNG